MLVKECKGNMKDHAISPSEGSPLHIWVPCNGVVQSKHSEWERTQTKTDMRTDIWDILFHFTKCTLLNCACIEKKEGREGKTDKLLRTPYNHWSMHGLNQRNLQMLTAFTDINFSYVNSFRILHNKKKLWKFSKKKDMVNRTPSIVIHVNNISTY